MDQGPVGPSRRSRGDRRLGGRSPAHPSRARASPRPASRRRSASSSTSRDSQPAVRRSSGRLPRGNVRPDGELVPARPSWVSSRPVIVPSPEREPDAGMVVSGVDRAGHRRRRCCPFEVAEQLIGAMHEGVLVCDHEGSRRSSATRAPWSSPASRLPRIWRVQTGDRSALPADHCPSGPRRRLRGPPERRGAAHRLPLQRHARRAPGLSGMMWVDFPTAESPPPAGQAMKVPCTAATAVQPPPDVTAHKRGRAGARAQRGV